MLNINNEQSEMVAYFFFLLRFETNWGGGDIYIKINNIKIIIKLNKNNNYGKISKEI